MALQSIPIEWQQWTLENIQRGCDPAEVIQVMTDNQFEAETASGLVAEMMQHQLTHPDEAFPYCGTFELKPQVQQETVCWKRDEHEIYPVLMELDDPCVVLFGNVLSPDECNELIERMKPRLIASTGVDMKTGKQILTPDRSSQNCFFDRCEDEFITQIDRRLSKIMQLPLENGEGLQAVHYGINKEYKPHYDYFDPAHSGSVSHINRQGGQRIATLIVYLNTVEEGGKTVFPKLGIKARAIQGNAIYFSYGNHIDPAHLDKRSLHGGAPVVRGEKWIVNKWMRQNEFV